jgi:pimeloyl-ACP methyl ester carboxylesterase
MSATRFPHRLFAASMLLLSVATATASPDFRGGSYQGLIDTRRDLQPVRVQFEAVDHGWRAQVRLPGAPASLPATVAIRGRQLTLQLAGPDGPLECAGTITGPAIVGATNSGGCHLELVATNGGTLAQELGGAWQDDAGHVYAIARSGDSPDPMWLDYGSGAWRGLTERDGALHAGPSVAAPWPEQLRLVRDGDALRLHRASGPKKGVRLTRIAFVEQPLEWKAGDVTLKGTLILPPGDGPHPALVLTQMSSPGIRDGYRQFAYFFAAHGIASLIYDRRGSGESGGEEGSAGMHRLADDAVAAVEALRALPQIDAKRIGTWGHSQGGWVAPIAAARSPAIAFVIAQSAPGVSPARQEIFRVGQSARAAGLDEAEIVAAVDYETRLMEWVRSGNGRDQIHALAKANANARWARFVELREDLPETPSARSKTFWTFDPKPDLARVRVPILLIHGDRDAYVPVEESRAILREVLADTRAEFHLLPRAAHGLWLGETDSSRDAMRSPGFHPDYWPTLLGWLQRQRLVAAPGEADE